MIAPLHIATVGGRPLRFFRSPLNDGLPDLVWHCVDDLHRCLGLNREARKHFLHKLRGNKNWSAIVRTVATADGPVTVAPHFMAQGWIHAMIDQGEVPASIEWEYVHASGEAQKKLGVPFPFPSDEYLDWMKAARDRWEEAEP